MLDRDRPSVQRANDVRHESSRYQERPRFLGIAIDRHSESDLGIRCSELDLAVLGPHEDT
jgi:hypothetical protein